MELVSHGPKSSKVGKTVTTKKGGCSAVLLLVKRGASTWKGNSILMIPINVLELMANLAPN